MRNKSLIMIAVLVVLNSCTPTFIDSTALSTAVLPPTATITKTPTATNTVVTPTITNTPTNESQSEYRVDEFSDNYYGVVYIEPTDEFYQQGKISIYDSNTDNELINVFSDKIYLNFHNGKIQANILELPYGEQSLIIYDDFNFDGDDDFAIRDNQVSCYGGPSYKVFLFNNGQFLLNEEFSRLAHEYCGMFMVDDEEQKIYTMTKSGCCWHQYSEFTVEDNTPYLQKIVEHEVSFPYNSVITKERIGEEFIENIEKHIEISDLAKSGYIIFSFDLLDGRKAVLFSLDRSTLIFVISTKDEIVTVTFPTDKEENFTYIVEQNQVLFNFEHEGIKYEIFEVLNDNVIEKTGIQITENEQSLLFEGDVATIRGNLLQAGNTKWENVTHK